jgi:hypothetical protein
MKINDNVTPKNAPFSGYDDMDHCYAIHAAYPLRWVVVEIIESGSRGKIEFTTSNGQILHNWVNEDQIDYVN